MNSKLKLLLITLFFFLTFNSSNSSEVYFIDFGKVLNQSVAGSQFQGRLKKQIENNANEFKKKEDQIRKDETNLVSQKKSISNEEYETKVKLLRENVANLQKEKQKSFSDISNSRNQAKKVLIDTINPILKKYMEENNIRIVLDKQNIILADTKLEITEIIIELLNQNLKTIRLN